MEISCRVYRPRDPRKTPLFGLLDSLYDRVKGAWEERFEPTTTALEAAKERKRNGNGTGLLTGEGRFREGATQTDPDDPEVVPVCNTYEPYPKTSPVALTLVNSAGSLQ